jgi:hypothetical protein
LVALVVDILSRIRELLFLLLVLIYELLGLTCLRALVLLLELLLPLLLSLWRQRSLSVVALTVVRIPKCNLHF